MPRVKNAYQCSRCSTLMPSKERTSRRVRMVGHVNIEYDEDLCVPCANEEVEIAEAMGRETRPLRTRNRRGSSDEQPERDDDDAPPQQRRGRPRSSGQSHRVSSSDAAA